MAGKRKGKPKKESGTPQTMTTTADPDGGRNSIAPDISDPAPPADPASNPVTSESVKVAAEQGLALFKSRILPPDQGGYRMVKASSLKMHPKNWRMHPEYQQHAIRSVLNRIGWVDCLKCRELPDGTLELFDGHLRQEVSGDQEVPVLVCRLTDRECDEILATFDPITTIALPDNDKLTSLLKELHALDTPLMDMGWPEYRLEQVLAEQWVPAASKTEDALNRAAAGAGAEGTGQATPTPPSGYLPFNVMLTAEQDTVVREAIKAAKDRFKVDTTGDALFKLVEEWAGLQG